MDFMGFGIGFAEAGAQMSPPSPDHSALNELAGASAALATAPSCHRRITMAFEPNRGRSELRQGRFDLVGRNASIDKGSPHLGPVLPLGLVHFRRLT